MTNLYYISSSVEPGIINSGCLVDVRMEASSIHWNVAFFHEFFKSEPLSAFNWQDKNAPYLFWVALDVFICIKGKCLLAAMLQNEEMFCKQPRERDNMTVV